MEGILKRLNYKNQKQIFVLDAPESFNGSKQSIADSVEIVRKIGKKDVVEFAIGFTRQQKQLNELVNAIAPSLKGDAVLWLCYPKATSKKYTCDFNRDTGWSILGDYNLEPVRQIAIDEDWSALRFRKVEFIKKLTRRNSMALSPQGKARTK